VYAGAAREAVFSRSEVIRKVADGFVPLALRAPLVNGMVPGGHPDESRLYGWLRRAMLAPQGIGVLTDSGQVMQWVQMFDDPAAVIGFLDRAQSRFAELGSGPAAVAAERYMKYPGQRMADTQEEGKPEPIATAHPTGTRCPAEAHSHSAVPAGALGARVVGRALNVNGAYVDDTVRQEHYSEDRFHLTADLQREIARALAGATSGRVRLPDALGRLCALNAYLGHIDVRPLENPGRGAGAADKVREALPACELWAEMTDAGGGEGSWRIQGRTEVASSGVGTGRYRHDVRLDWEGYVALKGDRVEQLVLSGTGREKLQYGDDSHPAQAGSGDEVTYLPGGRRIDQECGVRYGIEGKAAVAGEAPIYDRTPDPAGASVQEKGQQLHAAIEGVMQKLTRLMNDGRAPEAMALLDRAITALERAVAETPDGPPGMEGLAREREQRAQPIREKMEKLQQGIRRWQEAGRDPGAIGRLMQDFEPRMRSGDLDAAERLLDEALGMVEK